MRYKKRMPMMAMFSVLIQRENAITETAKARNKLFLYLLTKIIASTDKETKNMDGISGTNLTDVGKETLRNVYTNDAYNPYLLLFVNRYTIKKMLIIIPAEKSMFRNINEL
jgi:hypothetical protein